ncbi:YqzH family protein [Rossellomorea sp. BNER]|jgi:hypothetical protein|uniref:YqzH family protein n=1 Tax=Rossellomorea sp. BNER TaxID=2962031 RepID=UPI003AF2B917|nr:YqzH family protein [Rossellomorea sp. BNER]
MEQQMMKRMIQKCFLQYEHSVESLPLNNRDYERLYSEIMERYQRNESAEIYELVEDVVYEFLVG